MPVKAVFFDIDGTLVDSDDQHVLAWQQALEEAGHSFSLKAIHAQIGKGADMLVPALLPQMHEHARKRLGAREHEIFRAQYMPKIRPFPDARALVERVHAAGLKVVLATSASAEERDHYVELLGIGDLLTASTSADDVEHTKPAPDVFAAALRKVAPIGPDEVMVVGDTPFDVQAAAGCGIRTIALRSGKFDDAVLRDAGAVAIYDDAADLLARFDRSPLAVAETV